MFDIKNRRYVVWGLVAILFAVSMVFVDLFLFPYQESEETIVAYSLIKQGKSDTVTGYHFYTDKGTEFSLEQDFVKEDVVVLSRTTLYEQVVGVKTEKRDYSSLLSSGFNGFSLVLIVVLTFSTIIGLIKLSGTEPLTVNQYQNYVLFTGFMLFCVVSIWLVFN